MTVAPAAYSIAFNVLVGRETQVCEGRRWRAAGSASSIADTILKCSPPNTHTKTLPRSGEPSMYAETEEGRLER